MKKCKRCGVEKETTEYYSSWSSRDNKYKLGVNCIPCEKIKGKEYREANRGTINDRYYLYSVGKKFGLSPEEYMEIFNRQKGKCAICKEVCSSGRRLAVDHDHNSGKVRGLLCNNCNQALGRFKDDPKRLRAAIRYLGNA